MSYRLAIVPVLSVDGDAEGIIANEYSTFSMSKRVV